MNEASRLDLATGFLVAATLLLLSVGQILFKWTSSSLKLNDPRSFGSPSLIAALIVYGVATVMWILVLKKLPLSLAFSFYGLTFLLVPLLAHYVLGEKIGYQTMVGGAIIMFGVLVTSWGKNG